MAFDLDASDEAALTAHVEDHKPEAVVSGLPYFCNVTVARIAREHGLHYFDLTEDVAVTRAVRRLAEGFPFPDQAALEAADRLLAAVPDGTLVVVDGLALGAMPAQAQAHAARLRLVALVHHPLALETGLDREKAQRLYDSERRALAAVRRVLVRAKDGWWRLPERRARLVKSLIARGFTTDVAFGAIGRAADERERSDDEIHDQPGDSGRFP